MADGDCPFRAKTSSTITLSSFAAALSYYFVMAFFPALIALAAIIAYLPIPNLFNTIVSTLSRVMPPESMGLVRKVVAEIITPNRERAAFFRLAGDAVERLRRLRQHDRGAQRGLRHPGDAPDLEDSTAGARADLRGGNTHPVRFLGDDCGAGVRRVPGLAHGRQLGIRNGMAVSALRAGRSLHRTRGRGTLLSWAPT